VPTVFYNKLVRDKIPDIISDSGKIPVVEFLDDKSYQEFLDRKLAEELEEYLNSGNIEELADMTEVIIAIIKHKNVSYNKFNEIVVDKHSKRGGFDRRLLLKEVISD